MESAVLGCDRYPAIIFAQVERRESNQLQGASKNKRQCGQLQTSDLVLFNKVIGSLVLLVGHLIKARTTKMETAQSSFLTHYLQGRTTLRPKRLHLYWEKLTQLLWLSQMWMRTVEQPLAILVTGRKHSLLQMRTSQFLFRLIKFGGSDSAALSITSCWHTDNMKAKGPVFLLPL